MRVTVVSLADRPDRDAADAPVRSALAQVGRSDVEPEHPVNGTHDQAPAERFQRPPTSQRNACGDPAS